VRRIPVTWLAGALVVAAVLVSLSALRAERRRANATRRLLDHQATLAAYNFAYRAASAIYAVADAGARRVANGSPAALVAYYNQLDSAWRCRCPAVPRPVAVATLGPDGTPTSVVPRQEISLLAPVHRTHRIGAPLPDVRIDSVDGAILRVSPTGQPFTLATVYSAPEFAAHMFGAVWRLRPAALPASLTGHLTNDSALTLHVRDRQGRTLYVSAPGDAAGDVVSTAWVGMDSLALVEVRLRPHVAARIEDGLGGSGPPGLPLGLTALALLALVLAVVRSEALSRMRERLAVAVSHELRTPVAQMLLYAELATDERTAGEAQTKETLQVILREARYLSHLVRNTLHVAMQERRGRSRVFQDFPLQATITQVAEAMESRARERDVTLTIEGGGGVRVSGDPDALQLGLSNVLDNAIRYSAPGSAVSVQVTRDEGKVIVRVRDRGPGIAPAAQRRVWRPFERADLSARHPDGTGLGLAVARDMIARGGGTIAIESSDSSGTVMRIALVAAQES
jgi:signal transduction histidine kinase